MTKKILKKIIFNSKTAKLIVPLALRWHNFSYWLAGTFSVYLEPDGLHPKHRIMKYHAWFCDQLSPEWRVLDVGCGNGALAADLAKRCKEVVGIDNQEKNVLEARENVPKAKILLRDINHYSFEADERFDAVILSNILEHIEDRVAFLAKIAKLSDVLLVRVPAFNRDWITVYKKERGVEWRLHKGHFTEYTAETFKSEMSTAGLEIEKMEFMFGEIYALVRKQPSPKANQPKSTEEQLILR